MSEKIEAADSTTAEDRSESRLSTAWLAEYHRAVEALGDLREDWNTYGAAPPNDTAISLAKLVLTCLAARGLRPHRVNPSAEEGVCISFRNGRLYADIECFNTGEVAAATSDGLGQHRVWEVAPDREGIEQTLAHIGAHLNPGDS